MKKHIGNFITIMRNLKNKDRKRNYIYYGIKWKKYKQEQQKHKKFIVSKILEFKETKKQILKIYKML